MKALAVFSGGLDSMLAAQIIRTQDIEVQGLFFETPFFTSTNAKNSARTIDLPLKIIDMTEIHLQTVKSPKHGYGGNMNPCIDCHALMLRKAGDMLDKERAGFIITGEVMGQRPMSQNMKALSIVASESGYPGLILRPLSAKRLPPTLPEERGWVDREALLGFSGRSRKPQMALAEQFKIKTYPSPAGGCLLTDQVFSRRLRDLLASKPKNELRDIKLLKIGRHFRISPQTKLIVGRNQRENELLKSLYGEGDLLLSARSVPGPMVLIVGDPSEEAVELAATMGVAYSDAQDSDWTEISLLKEDETKTLQAKGCDKERFKKYMI